MENEGKIQIIEASVFGIPATVYGIYFHKFSSRNGYSFLSNDYQKKKKSGKINEEELFGKCI